MKKLLKLLNHRNFSFGCAVSVLKVIKSKDTINVNISGTANLLEASKSIKSIKSIIIATTDKVYLNLEKRKPFSENDKLGGHDIYSGSKQ